MSEYETPPFVNVGLKQDIGSDTSRIRVMSIALIASSVRRCFRLIESEAVTIKSLFSIAPCSRFLSLFEVSSKSSSRESIKYDTPAGRGISVTSNFSRVGI